MHLENEFRGFINSVRCIKKRRSARCIHKMQEILSVNWHRSVSSLSSTFFYKLWSSFLFHNPRVSSNEAVFPRMKRRCCKHVICQTCMLQCSHIGSVCHASDVRGCVLLSASSSLIYHFWFLKHHHSAATHHHHLCCWRSCNTHENCMHAEQIIIIFHIYIFFLLYVFGIVLNCIIQNNSHCLHWQYLYI